MNETAQEQNLAVALHQYLYQPSEPLPIGLAPIDQERMRGRLGMQAPLPLSQHTDVNLPPKRYDGSI